MEVCWNRWFHMNLLLEYHAESIHQKGKISRESGLCMCRISSSFAMFEMQESRRRRMPVDISS